MGEIMRLTGILFVCLLVGLFALSETNAAADVPRTLQDNLALYVCAGGKLVKFDAATGAKLDVFFPGPELPADVDVAQDGALLISEEEDRLVLRFDPATGQFDEGPFGETDRLGAPRGIAVKPNGHLFVAELFLCAAPSEVLEFDENGVYVQHHPDDDQNPLAITLEDLACNDSGDLFATQAFLCLDETPGVLRSTATGWELFGDTGDLVTPWGLAFGPDGDLYVVDDDSEYFVHVGVFRYDGTTGAEKGLFVEAGPDTDLIEPRYLTFGPDGNLYVTDAQDGSVRVFNGPLTPNPGAFQGVFGETAGEVEGPLGLVFGPAGSVPELSIEKVDETVFRVTLEKGVDGKTYEVRCSPTLTEPFESWAICGTITLEGSTTGTFEDNTVSPEDSQKFYTVTEQSAP